MNKEEIQRRLIEGIRDNYTLNLAISILEDLDLANKKLEKLDNEIKSVINIIKQQPSNDDEWILGRLNGFLSIIGKE